MRQCYVQGSRRELYGDKRRVNSLCLASVLRTLAVKPVFWLHQRSRTQHSDGWKLPPGEVSPSYTSSLSPAAQLLPAKAPQARRQKTQETLTTELCC